VPSTAGVVQRLGRRQTLPQVRVRLLLPALDGAGEAFLVGRVAPGDVEPCALVQPCCAGRVLGVDLQPDAHVAALPECEETRLEEREAKTSPAPVTPDEELQKPSHLTRSEADPRAGDLVSRHGEPPERRVVVGAFAAGVEPVVERPRCELPVLREGLLVGGMECLVVLERTIRADPHAGRRRGHGRLGLELDLHLPEVTDELVSAILGEASTVVPGDMNLHSRQTSLARPALDPIQQLPAEPEPACVGTHARLVRDVRQIPLGLDARVGNDLALAQGDPRVGLEARLIAPPPLAELVAREGDAVDGAEVRPVALGNQRRNAVCIVERRRPDGDLRPGRALDAGAGAAGLPRLPSFVGEPFVLRAPKLGVRFEPFGKLSRRGIRLP
jgi:hypothetical protein